MQSNTIQITVDTVENDYERIEETVNRSVYAAEGHTVSAKDIMAFYRTQPKKSGNFRGMAKCAVKFTKDVETTGVDGTTLSAPIIVEVGFAVPVGASSASAVTLRKLAAQLMLDETVMIPLVDRQVI